MARTLQGAAGRAYALLPSTIEKEKNLMDQTQLLAHCGSNKITREELRMVPTPEGTESHHPLAHHLIVEALAETLAFRHISVVRDEYAVSEDAMKMFPVLDLETSFEGSPFPIHIRNS